MCTNRSGRPEDWHVHCIADALLGSGYGCCVLVNASIALALLAHILWGNLVCDVSRCWSAKPASDTPKTLQLTASFPSNSLYGRNVFTI